MEKKERKQKEAAKSAEARCNDIDCQIHGKLKVRGKTFEGSVIKKFPRRITIEFQRMVYVRKYERYSKSKTKLHARLPECMKDQINVGDYIMIQECRPLSKIIHFAVIKKIKDKRDLK
ncbi:30S ribosomal protein S17 [Candidatus Pacearchaeota archaeon]|nr:30S ribosomal protein S17 [Candidatus Pacearchaeota archaeon]